MSEKNFPVSTWWILIGPASRRGRAGLSPLFVTVLLVMVAIVFGVVIGVTNTEGVSLPYPIATIFGLFWIVLVFPTIAGNFFRRMNFRFDMEDKVLTVRCGVFKKEQKQIPYATLQDVVVVQDLAHRLFGLAEVVIENAAAGGGFGGVADIAKAAFSEPFSRSNNNIGICGDKVVIPGLRRQNAEDLKTAIVQKMQQNKSIDTGAGL